MSLITFAYILATAAVAMGAVLLIIRWFEARDREDQRSRDREDAIVVRKWAEGQPGGRCRHDQARWVKFSPVLPEVWMCLDPKCPANIADKLSALLAGPTPKNGA